jgi:hypothetical protein
MRHPVQQQPKTTAFRDALRPLVRDGASHYIPSRREYWVFGPDWAAVLFFCGVVGWETSPRFESTGIPSEALTIAQ